MRDFGSYYRDPFNLDAIEVLKGPSSILFGRGSTGGVINQVSKQPGLDPFQAGSVSFGTDNTKRTTVDVNQPIPELAQGAAIRLDAMLHDSQVADRDVGEYQRYGVAPAVALGLGTPTRLNLNFFHQTEEDVPDYGLPFLLGRPAPVDRSNFYGFTSDYLDTNANIFTGRLEHDLNDAITLRDQFRYARYDRKARITEPQIPTTVTAATPLSSIQVTRNEITLNSVETFLQNQSDATVKFDTGFVKHTVVAGFEVGEETSDPTRFTLTGVPTTSLLSPNPEQPFTGASTVRSQVTTSATSVGTYLIDTLKIGEQWELTGGVRWDSFDSSFADAVANTSFSRLDQMPSWRTALTYKPARNGSVYFAYGTSFNPSAETLSLSSANANIAPEENESYEVGSKWDFFQERLSLRGAIYRVEKTNARVPDPDNPLLNTLGGDQRVDGFELEAVGRITEAWQVFTGYNFMRGKVIEASPVATTPQPGAPLTNTPKHTLSVWTTYELPWRTEVGGGLNYVSSRVARNTAPFETVPGYYTIDALVKYHLTPNVDVQVNLYNLTDTNYIDLVHPAHIVPGAGRSALFSTNFKF
ncbi:MAG TPA: TonB-dependent siderophore receptor, partial [Stellaceae bacterium]|nr:TonB-dependent siderophore receptor [Stellaceae bacterium]